MSNIRDEVSRRRTFAIISHPDAGKTTLTEKLLLFGGAIQLAGTVKGRKASLLMKLIKKVKKAKRYSEEVHMLTRMILIM